MCVREAGLSWPMCAPSLDGWRRRRFWTRSFFFFFSDAAPHASRDKKKKKASLCPVADDSSGLTAFDKFTRDLASAMAIARL